MFHDISRYMILKVEILLFICQSSNNRFFFHLSVLDFIGSGQTPLLFWTLFTKLYKDDLIIVQFVSMVCIWGGTKLSQLYVHSH
jgi:hypothetical protein